MNTEQIPPDRDRWDDFLSVEHPDIGFRQSSWWAAYMTALGWEHYGAILREGDRIFGGARIGRYAFNDDACFYYIGDGPVLPSDPEDAEQIFNAVVDFAKRRRNRDSLAVSHLRLEPRWQKLPSFVSGWQDALNWFEPRDTLHLDLAPVPNRILAQMKSKGRYNTRVAQRHGVTVQEMLPIHGVDTFFELYLNTQERKSMDGEPEEAMRWLFELVSTGGRGSLFVASYQEMPLAAALVVYHGDRATYLFGGSLSEHRNTMAPYLLHWEAILSARRKGYRWYDFYGVSPSGETDHSWAAISDFKRKFGGVEQSFIPGFDLVFDEAAYAAYNESREEPSADTS